MNKKKVLGIVTAIMITALSTSAIAFSSQASSKATKDVVKVAQAKTDNITKSNANTKENITNPNINPASVNKFIDISNDKAIQIAKQTIKSTFGADVDKEGFTEAHVYRPENFDKNLKMSSMQVYHMIGGNPSISVEFDIPNNAYPKNVFSTAEVEISLVDGKIKLARFHKQMYAILKDESQYDENKVKNTAIQFLKDKGFDTNYKNMTVDPRTANTKLGVITNVHFDYPDGSTINIDVDVANYIAFGYSKHKMLILQN